MMRWLFLLSLAFCSGSAWAGDSTTEGAPAFLLLSFPLFTAGLLWSCCVEGAVYQRYLGGPVAKSIWLALGVNILSTLIVGIGLPFAVAFISGIGIFIGGEIGGIFAALGSWVFKDSPYRDFAIAITIPWMIISFWLTLKFELWYLTQRLQIDAGGQTNIKAMCFYANVVGYGGLLIIALVVAVLYNL